MFETSKKKTKITNGARKLYLKVKNRSCQKKKLFGKFILIKLTKLTDTKLNYK